MTAQAKAAAVKPRKVKAVKTKRLNTSHTKTAWLFMIPYLIVFTLFTIIPFFASIVLSFTNFNMLQAPSFIGFANYIKLFLNDDIFLIALQNTLMFAIITGPLSYVLCFMFAWLINEVPRWPRAFLTLVFYSPSIAGNMFVIFKFIFSNDSHGILNGFLMQMGLISDPIQWLTDPAWMSTVVIIVVLWQSLGASFLTFIAGLQNVDKQYYEAAAIDGIRNRWQELWFVTLPLMKPQLMFGAVMSITGSFGIGGVITQMVGNPSTDYAVHTLVHHLEDYGGVRFEMGYASAIATLLFLMMIGANKLVQLLLRKVGT